MSNSYVIGSLSLGLTSIGDPSFGLVKKNGSGLKSSESSMDIGSARLIYEMKNVFKVLNQYFFEFPTSNLGNFEFGLLDSS